MMKRYTIYILALVMSLVLLACNREERSEVRRGPAMNFTASDPETKAFIDEINRSGNQLVVYDYMTGIEGQLVVNESDRWYIDHKRIQCSVDGQQLWDYVDTGDYFWLFGSSHNCFGWLFVGPSGYNTITFFGEHPEFEKENFRLPLPAYEFTMDSPLYDFLYSDITKRSFTQANPDSSPIALKMNHLFSAFRFKIRSVRQHPVTIMSATLKNLVTGKQATIDFGNARETAVESTVSVSYSNTATGDLTLSRGAQGHELTSESAAINLFDLADPDAFRMIWPQSEQEFESAVLEVTYEENGEQTTKEFDLNGFTPKQWLSGSRYAYELVFTDKEILLVCEVLPWTKKGITLDFTDVVVVSDKIQWHDNTISHLDEHTGEVLLFNSIDKPAECYFKIDAPNNATWHASLIPVGGSNTQAFCFVDPDNPAVVLDAPSGVVGDGSIGRLMIRVVDDTNQTDTNKAKLRIVVKTGNTQGSQTIVVENLCAGHDYNEYTIVQNMIIK